MSELASQGLAVIMVSSELPEVMGMSDRIVVMREGRIVTVLDNDEHLEAEVLVRAAAGIGGAACVIGGISIAGEIGTVAGALLGAAFLGGINTALPVINISPFWQMAISGAAIILAVVLNAGGEKRGNRLILREAGSKS
jgi:energy-coupling factor transporter ATP-binding protein EcfA2